VLLVSGQDKVLEKDIGQTKKEREKIKDISAKEATYPLPKNFKKEFKAIVDFKRQFLPIPIIYTDPNIGFTYGGGFGSLLFSDSGELRHILAPYVQYNDESKFGGTIRYMFLPTLKERYYFKIYKSEEINEEFLMEYINKKFYFDRLSFSVLGDIWDEGSARFFGIGKDTIHEDKMNYTHREQNYEMKLGAFISEYSTVNFGLKYRNVKVLQGLFDDEDQVIDKLSNNSLVRKEEIYEGKIRIKVNIFPEYDVDDAMMNIDFWGAYGEAFRNDNEEYLSWGLSSTWSWKALEKITIAGSINYQEVHGGNLPFYVLSELGGSRSMRGLELGRFFDKFSVSGMNEIRWMTFKLNTIGFTSDWEFALFYDYGMVANEHNEFSLGDFEHAIGIGIRTHFTKNVMTRVDIAYHDEGVKIFVDFGYPF